jgi:hypothetical protein
MYLDLEGVNLYREGSISILTLLLDGGVAGNRRVCLIDVHVLGARASTTTGVKGKTLQDILQDAAIPKVFFDVGDDLHALFALYGVALRDVDDVQLVESATRKTAAAKRRLVNVLAKICGTQSVCSCGWIEGDKIEGGAERLVDQNVTLDQWNHAPAPQFDLDDFFGPDDDPTENVDADSYDDGLTSPRDNIDDYDMHYYCSD